MNNVTKNMKRSMTRFLSLIAALLVIIGVQSQEKNYSVSKSVGDVVSSCWGTQVANAQDGAGLVWDKNNEACVDPWVNTGTDGSGDGGSAGCGGCDSSQSNPDCSNW